MDGFTLFMANQYEQGEHGCPGEAAVLLSSKDVDMERWADSESSFNPTTLNKELTMG